jgi:coiled-coil and C2 domain-containing protein 1
MVRIREPLTAQQLETTTERWLVIDHIPAAMPTVSPCLLVTSGCRARVRDSVLIGLTLPKQVTGPKAKAPLIPASSREAGNR